MRNIVDVINQLKDVIPSSFHYYLNEILNIACYHAPEQEREDWHKLYEVLIEHIIGFDEAHATLNFNAEWKFEAIHIFSLTPIIDIKNDYHIALGEQ